MINAEIPYIPERDQKPRENGVTMMMDKGLGLRETEDFIEASAHLTDLVKFGFGTSMVTRNLDDKIRLYRDAGLRPYLGGTLFEVFYARNCLDDYMRLLDRLKLDLVEVSDGSIIIPHKEKCRIIKKMAKNFTVLSEVGSKDSGILVSPFKWVSWMRAELNAGSWKVIAEGRESGNVGVFRPNGTAHTLLINHIIARIDPSKILWEAPQKNQQVWFIKLFGANVNLGNIAHNDIIPLECLRLGLRGDTFFEFLPEDYAERLRHVNEDDSLDIAEAK